MHDHVSREHLVEREDDDSLREYDWISPLHPDLSVLGSPRVKFIPLSTNENCKVWARFTRVSVKLALHYHACAVIDTFGLEYLSGLREEFTLLSRCTENDPSEDDCANPREDRTRRTESNFDIGRLFRRALPHAPATPTKSSER